MYPFHSINVSIPEPHPKQENPSTKVLWPLSIQGEILGTCCVAIDDMISHSPPPPPPPPTHTHAQCGSINIRIVVMNNLLPSTLKYQEKYDLKGSTYKRKANSREVAKNSPTFKDVDFKERHEEVSNLVHRLSNFPICS